MKQLLLAAAIAAAPLPHAPTAPIAAGTASVTYRCWQLETLEPVFAAEGKRLVWSAEDATRAQGNGFALWEAEEDGAYTLALIMPRRGGGYAGCVMGAG